VVNTEIDGQLWTVSWARRLVSDLLDQWELPALGEVATLLTSELVTNAVVYAGTGISLVIAVADGVLEIGVSDHDHASIESVKPKVERLAAKEGVTAEGGRGLVLVDSLADEWGVVQLAKGKQVWFRLSTDDWSYRSSCACHSDAIDRVRLESGRYALAIPGPWDA
jgi:anti-sigma regulatory factor (Ser/Thr protein kinase)